LLKQTFKEDKVSADFCYLYMITTFLLISDTIQSKQV